jgi:hypothetical protein
MNKRITNTSKQPNPAWLGGGNPNAIERQEAEGQKELVEAGCFLPTEAPEDLLSFIVTEGGDLGELVVDDPLFFHATLPEGWSIKPTDHSMWSDLVDADGVVVASIFYKAAFYDRKAHMHDQRR